MRARTKHASATKLNLRMTDHIFKCMYRHEALSKQGGRCCFCKDRVTHDDVTADHLTPIIRGGMTQRENIKASCLHCNKTKSLRTDREFRKILKAGIMPLPFSDLTKAWIRYRLNLRVIKAERRICRAVYMDYREAA